MVAVALGLSGSAWAAWATSVRVAPAGASRSLIWASTMASTRMSRARRMSTGPRLVAAASRAEVAFAGWRRA